MRSPKSRKPLFERLKAGLEEGIRHAKGEITLKTTTLELARHNPTGLLEVAGVTGPPVPGRMIHHRATESTEKTEIQSDENVRIGRRGVRP